MMKLKRIDGGLYCFLFTFDPKTEVLNIMDLQANNMMSLSTGSNKADSQPIEMKEELESVADTSKENRSKISSARYSEPPAQTKTQAAKSTASATEVKATEQAPKQETLPKPVREYKPHELLTRRETAAYLGVTEQTLAVWKCTGRYNIPYLKIGRLVKYRVADLDAYLERVRHGPREEQETQKPYTSSRYRSTRKVEF